MTLKARRTVSFLTIRNWIHIKTGSNRMSMETYRYDYDIVRKVCHRDAAVGRSWHACGRDRGGAVGASGSLILGRRF